MTTLPFSALPRKLDAAARALEPAEARIVRKGGEKMAKEITQAYRARTGDGRLSGTKTKRRQAAAPVFAKVKDVQRGKDRNFVALVVPQGAFGLLEQRIEPHFIDARRATDKGRKAAASRGRRKAVKATGSDVAGAGGAAIGLQQYLSGRTKALKTPLGFYAAVADPGIDNPRRVFTPTSAAAGPAVIDAMGNEARKIVRDAYRGKR